MKVMTILGTRPEIIRLSEVMKLLDRHADHKMVHTGQNYDHELNKVFFQDLDLRAPDHYLDVKADSVGEQIGNIIIATERVLVAERPDAILILGDTNSALSCIPAKRLKIPIFHMEAGNRCFDDRVPEEINRRIVDHTSDVNLTYTVHAKTNLLREGLPHDRVVVSGSPLPEIFAKHREAIERSDVVERLGLAPKRYFLVSAHREENVDDVRSLDALLDTLEALVQEFGVPAVVSTHPRTRKRLDALGRTLDPRVRFHKPFGFFDYVKLQKGALCNVSDSGTIHEDAAILGLPAVVIRNVTERPEAIDAGSVVLAGLRKDDVLQAVRLVLDQVERGVTFSPPADYVDANTSEKVVRIILGQARLVKQRVWRAEA